MRLGSITMCFLALLTAVQLRAQDSGVSEGYDHFYNLEYDEALVAFIAETEQRPDDPNAWNHLAHATLYRAMYRGGALESELVTGSNPFVRRQKVKTTPEEDQQFYDAIDKALDLPPSRLRENQHNPRSHGPHLLSTPLLATS